MADREKTIDAFSKCIRIGDEGFLNADCEHCPNNLQKRIAKGLLVCKDFEELSVEVPWQLAKDMLDMAKGQHEIVRCRDCIYYNSEPDSHGDCCNKIHWSRGLDWFCADGERREAR